MNIPGLVLSILGEYLSLVHFFKIIGLVILFMSSCESFGKCDFQEIGPFHLVYQFFSFLIQLYSFIDLISTGAQGVRLCSA